MERHIILQPALKTIKARNTKKMYRLWCDGASRGNGKNNSQASIGGVIKNEHGHTLVEYSKILPIGSTNNTAEYESLKYGLRHAMANDIKEISCNMDSNLVCQQLNGLWKIRSDHLVTLNSEIQALIKGFNKFELTYIPRNLNSEADALANRILDNYYN